MTKYLICIILILHQHSLNVNGLTQVIETNNGKIVMKSNIIKKHENTKYTYFIKSVLPSITPVSRHVCSQTCIKASNCSSYTYEKSRGTCHFYSATPSSEYKDYFRSSKFDVYEVEVRIVTSMSVRSSEPDFKQLLLTSLVVLTGKYV